jgi:hypothetical protein
MLHVDGRQLLELLLLPLPLYLVLLLGLQRLLRLLMWQWVGCSPLHGLCPCLKSSMARHLLVGVHLPLLGMLPRISSMLTTCWLLLLLLPRRPRLLLLLVAIGRLLLVDIGLLGSIGLWQVTVALLLHALLLLILLSLGLDPSHTIPADLQLAIV